MFYKTVSKPDVSNRYAIVMAAGDGLRLRSLFNSLRGDALPKQYVKFFGERWMLQSTFERAQRLIPRERILTVVSQSHFEFAEDTQQLVDQHVVIQPSNRDTAIGLRLPLAHLPSSRTARKSSCWESLPAWFAEFNSRRCSC